jgi:hypothetical protein
MRRQLTLYDGEVRKLSEELEWRDREREKKDDDHHRDIEDTIS